MSTSVPDRHIAAARSRLVHLQGLAGRTAATERSILSAAEQRLTAVEKEAAQVANRVLTDIDAANRYTTLVQERGQLRTVIASARQALCL